jgi:hypothetical protein
MQIDERRLAIHESGHAVMATLRGIPLAYVTIVREKKLAGRCVYAECAAHVLDLAAVALAGPEAEKLGGFPWDAQDAWGCAGDFESAREEIESLALAEDGKLDNTLYDAYLTDTEGRMRHDLQQHWSAVEALAAALMERGTIPGDEASALVLGYERGLRAAKGGA